MYCVRSVNTQVRVRFNDRCRVIETTTTRPYIVRYIAGTSRCRFVGYKLVTHTPIIDRSPKKITGRYHQTRNRETPNIVAKNRIASYRSRDYVKVGGFESNYNFS